MLAAAKTRHVGGLTATPARNGGHQPIMLVIELVIRLVEGINDALRNVMRYRSDLSAMVVEALTAVDLVTVAFIGAEEPLVLPTTFTLPKPLLARVKRVAKERGTSMLV